LCDAAIFPIPRDVIYSLFELLLFGKKALNWTKLITLPINLYGQLYLRAHYQVLAAFSTIPNLVVMAIVLLSSQTLV